MPSASTIQAAYEALAEAARERQVKHRGDAGLQLVAQLEASRADAATRALEPLVAGESERLAAEAQGYVDRGEAA